MQNERPVIVGAGPVGLAAALFLARDGWAGPPPRLVEQHDEPSRRSKALAINPRTLDLLVESGVTARLLQLGEPLRGLRLHRGDDPRRFLASAEFAGVHPRHPYLLALSQATTERQLEAALVAEGLEVERGVRMIACRAVDGTVELELERASDAPRETLRAPWVLAADGARSAARRMLGIPFQGSDLDPEWHLADAPLATELEPDRAHAFLRPHGEFLFLVRAVDGEPAEPGAPLLWRVIGNRPHPLARLAGAEVAGEPVWTSSFRVEHRIAAEFSHGNVHLAGDAAHVHSAVGARGMNLGIEDAWVFARLAHLGRLGEYAELRRPIDAEVVHRVERITRVVSGKSLVDRAVRRVVPPVAIRVRAIRRRLLAVVAGLDHPLPDLAGGETAALSR
jgi:2-polyprenyl-6-methoxyphenol hydroxylase-like FAD-dependent oxidoreductase